MMKRKTAEKTVASTHAALDALSELGGFSDADYNPRTISPDALKSLRASVSVFGDLSGFVVNRCTGNVVCGHQRREASREIIQDGITWDDGEHVCNLGMPDARFESVERFGFVVLASGQRFGVREVNWSEGFEKAANVAANNPAIQGEFSDGLQIVLEDIKLDFSGFEALKFDALSVEIPDSPGQEFGENAADDVVMIECPHCGKTFPK